MYASRHLNACVEPATGFGTRQSTNSANAVFEKAMRVRRSAAAFMLGRMPTSDQCCQSGQHLDSLEICERRTPAGHKQGRCPKRTFCRGTVPKPYLLTGFGF